MVRYPTAAGHFFQLSALLNRQPHHRRCWAQHHCRSQHAEVASLGRVPAECRRGLRSPPATARRLLLPAPRRRPLSPAEPPRQQTMLGRNTMVARSTLRWPVLAGCRQSSQGTGRRLHASVITGPPARGGGQSWQGAGRVPPRPQVAACYRPPCLLPATRRAPPPLLNRQASRRC